MLETHESTIIQLKCEKDKLNKKIQEKDLFINKLMNENTSNHVIHDLPSLIDQQIEAMKKEVQTFMENAKRSPSVSPKNHNPINKLNELKAKFESSSKILADLGHFSQPSKNGDSCKERSPINYSQIPELEKHDFRTFTCKHEEVQKELNQTIHSIKTEATEIIRKYENDCKILKAELEKSERGNKKLRKDMEEISQETTRQMESKNKEISDLTIENEALAHEIGKLIQEKSKILDNQQLNEERFEKMIKTLEEEKHINKEKCSTLHKDYNLIHDHSNVKIHKCEKEIEIKIAEIHHLNDQVNVLSKKMQEEKSKKLNLTEEKEALLESKDQEIINLKIDLNKMESKIQSQSEEMMKLERNHSITMESFDVVLEEKENEIVQLQKGLKEAEEQLIEERRKIQAVLETTSPMTLSPSMLSMNDTMNEEKKVEKEIDRVKNLEAENEKLKKDLRVLKKSLKETLDLNDIFSRDLQKMKHKSP